MSDRQAGADESQVTPQMIEAGLRVLASERSEDEILRADRSMVAQYSSP